MDSLVKALKVFVVVGGIVLIGGTGALIWLLVNREQPESEVLPLDPLSWPEEIILPDGARIEQMTGDSRTLYLLVGFPDGGKAIVRVRGIEIDIASVTFEQ